MSDFDNFEDRLRAIADEISQSVQRISERDIEEFSQRYGIDADRARAFTDAASQWLTGRLGGDPLFGRAQSREPSAARSDGAGLDLDGPSEGGSTSSTGATGPHPLDLPTDQQGIALSALDSGRWTVRPGSNQLAGTGVGAQPAPSDVVGDLRARDWITTDGTPTLVGRHALTRWCRTVEGPAPAAPEADAPAA